MTEMKIIHIMDNLNVSGGVNSFVYDLCLAMKKQGIDVSLIGILDSKEKNNDSVKKLRENGIEVLCLGAKNKKEAIVRYCSILRKSIEHIAGDKPTVCNLHLKLSVLLGGLATIGLKNVKCVETYHSQYSHYSLEYNLMKYRISLYIPCSKSAGIEMQSRFHVPTKKMHVISNGIDCKSISKIMPEKKKGITILSVGRLTKQKNYPVMIEVFNELDLKDIKYNIIGSGEDEETLKQMTTTESIHFLGTMERESVLAQTAGADLICMPSLWEGLSIYMMEAFSLGRPMILSDIPSFREAVDERKLGEKPYRKCEWGYLVKVDDQKAYKAAIINFIENKDEWEKMQIASLKMAERFDIQITSRKYAEAYSSFATQEI
mgnify:FL=1